MDILPPPTFIHDGLCVKPSLIHGNGLFATKDLPAEYKLADYQGDVLHITEAKKKYGSYKYMYRMLRQHKCIVGVEAPYLTLNPSHYANEGTPNIILKKKALYTLTSVKAGDELLLNYGRGYPRPWLKQ